MIISVWAHIEVLHFWQLRQGMTDNGLGLNQDSLGLVSAGDRFGTDLFGLEEWILKF